MADSSDHDSTDADSDGLLVAEDGVGGAPLETADRASLLDQIDELENRLADRDLELSRYTVRAAEAEDDLSNARLRLTREAEKNAFTQRCELLREFLDVLDNLDRALGADSATVDQLRTGLDLVHKQFLAALAKFGVEEMNPTGRPFDPKDHEAMSTISAASPDQKGCVIAVLQKGYKIGDEILRPAKVVVAS